MYNYSRSIKKENLIMLIMAAAIILFNIIGFIVVYFVWKEYSKESEFIEYNGRILLNFHLSFFIYEVIAGISILALIGVILVPLVSLVYFVLTVIGLFKYVSYKSYEYPLTFNILR